MVQITVDEPHKAALQAFPSTSGIAKIGSVQVKVFALTHIRTASYKYAEPGIAFFELWKAQLRERDEVRDLGGGSFQHGAVVTPTDASGRPDFDVDHPPCGTALPADPAATWPEAGGTIVAASGAFWAFRTSVISTASGRSVACVGGWAQIESCPQIG